MQFATIATLIAAAGLTNALPFVEERADSPPADSVKITDLTYAGTGCPPGSLEKQLSDARDLVTVMFSKYTAESGPGISPSKNRAACQLNLKMKYPQGYQFGVFKADYRGYVNLDKGAKGSSKATYYFSGDSKQVSRVVNFAGPIAKDYTKTDVIGVESAVWSPCGVEGMLNIKTSVDIEPLGSKNPNLIGVDSADFKYTQLYAIQWRKCNKK